MQLYESSPDIDCLFKEKSILVAFSNFYWGIIFDKFLTNITPFVELLEYAGKIGINIETERHLLYLAREGLLAELPDDWKPW